MKQILPALFLFSWIFLRFSGVVSAQVFINEFSSSTSDDWVELFSSEDIDISGWILRDTASSKVKTVPTATTIGPSSSKYYLLDAGNRLNSDTDVVNLYLPDDSTLVDKVAYGDSGNICAATGSQTVGRKPDGGSVTRFLISSKGQENNQAEELCSVPTETITTTESPTETPTSTPTPSKSIYTINKSKDETGQELSSVEIYVDSMYTHHLDNEILEFCNGCFCDPDKAISCGYGQHTIKLTKSGYSDWSEIRNFTQGTNYEITPILTKISSPTPTKTPTPAPTRTPTPTVAKTTPLTLSPSPNKQPITNNSSLSSPSSILGTSTSSAVIANLVPELKQSPPSNTTVLKYTFVFGAILTAISGGWLYFRHHSD